MYNPWKGFIAPYDKPQFLASLQTKNQSGIIAQSVTTRVAKIARRKINIPDQQANEWIKINEEWIVSPENYND